MDYQVLWKDRRVRYGTGAILIIILLLLLRGCETKKGSILSMDEYVLETSVLVMQGEKIQEEWNRLMSTTAFEDMCTEVYAVTFEKLGQEFIDTYDSFMILELEGDKATKIPNYHQYLMFFQTYNQIGQELQRFSATVKKGNYQEALVVIDSLLVLNKQIPIIE